MAQKLKLTNTVLQLKLNKFQSGSFDCDAKLKLINNGFLNLKKLELKVLLACSFRFPDTKNDQLYGINV